ncbi:uncharacterized protein K444DRAFT_666723 [Hyaloscypha bicolor E]|uniref:Uncharacterized protein n=1 Tax=Hyaloscypha bicolor E TaxID=1095630 RepID=A0A2J6SXK1_9HELO|nr:uncharacterized protein K444DRAFT_666723 [Hyaloscypha bicolor E]PMD55499.1 hypothetical protein K444DRAFT_666723 [Hyaloscypha bicolor E]
MLCANPTMPSQSNQQPIWTPPVIATIVYRVVMIIVSIAFIWKKYRRTARRIDEEQLIGLLLPTYNNHTPHRPPSPNTHNHTRSRRTSPSPHPLYHPRSNPQSQHSHPPTTREIISAHLDDIIQSALGLSDDGLSSLGGSQYGSSVDIAEGSSLEDMGVDVEVEGGDVGLRHRSADSVTEHRKVLRRWDLK